MNTQEAIEVLSKIGVHVDKVGKNQFKIWYDGGQVCSPYIKANSKRVEGIWTGREVIDWAKHPHNISKGSLKHFDATKNRSSTRDKIKTEDFDNIPQKGKVKGENPWSWD